jgi:hypothetical protein
MVQASIEKSEYHSVGRSNTVAKQQRLQIKFPEKVLQGIYANQMAVSHTREEFLIDFINLFPPEGVVNARIIVSPGHFKRMIRALKQNLARYEATHGPVIEAAAPEPPESMQN